MSEKTYMIVFDVADERLDIRPLQFHIKEDREILHWWNHLPSLFLVETKLNATELGRRVHALLGNTSFIVMEVNTQNTAGLLPEDAGAWVQRRITRASPETKSPERV